MNKLWAILFLLLGLALLVLAVFLSMGYFKPKDGGLLIESTPTSSVLIDGVEVGKTPYDKPHRPGDYVVKLIPDATTIVYPAYEARVSVTSKVKTVIKREFGETEELTSGETISFEKSTGEETALSIVSVPDSAQVRVDGINRGFAPVKVGNIAPGGHQVSVLVPGYVERTLSLNVIPGYRLTVVVKLAPDLEARRKEEEERLSEEKKVYVLINETPTGFLRVRAEASSVAAVVGQVTPGEKYEFIEEVVGWFKIRFDESEGWVSDEFSQKVEEN